MTSDRDRYRRLEIDRRRPGAMHPDACCKLLLHGVAFAIPPRGLRVRPAFDSAGRAKLRFVGADRWPRVAEVLARVARVVAGRRLRLDLDGSADLLCDLMTLARKALLAQYDLSDEQVAELLSFDTHERPAWIPGLLRWAQGLPTACEGDQAPGPTQGRRKRPARRLWRRRPAR